MSFVAFLDACVLYPACLRDVLLTVAEAGICQIRWSSDVLDEMERNVATRTKGASAQEAENGALYPEIDGRGVSRRPRGEVCV